MRVLQPVAWATIPPFDPTSLACPGACGAVVLTCAMSASHHPSRRPERSRPEPPPHQSGSPPPRRTRRCNASRGSRTIGRKPAIFPGSRPTRVEKWSPPGLDHPGHRSVTTLEFILATKTLMARIAQLPHGSRGQGLLPEKKQGPRPDGVRIPGLARYTRIERIGLSWFMLLPYE